MRAVSFSESTILILALCSTIVVHGCGGGVEPADEDAPSSATTLESTLPAVVPIRNARVPLPGVLTGGQPTEEQLLQAAQAGYKTIVTLRTPGELSEWDEASVVRSAGMRFEEIPVEGAAGLTSANAERLASLLAEEGAKPVMIHCASGNRVGALLALVAHRVEGASIDEAMQLGREAGVTRLERATRELLEGSPAADLP
ncbi:MAG: protein tyrosine phosphatase family protein [Acidobacteriota bacterium]|nr:protein tyrosine phosphatase family protein [Acidobacteriota bacterium]